MEKKEVDNFIINYYKNDIVIGNSIKNGKLWGSENKLLFKKDYRSNSNILDIGGFIGTISLILSEIIDKNREIYVFEPQYYDCLIKNIKDNNLEHIIKPYKYGLANIEGFIPSNNIDLNKSGNYGGQHLTCLYDKKLEEYTIEKKNNTIELKKLDNFDFNNIGLIKIDVEGFELLVLQGGIETLKKNNYPTIFIEIWDTVCWRNKEETKSFYKKNKEDIINFMLNLNYKIDWNQGHDYIFVHNN